MMIGGEPENQSHEVTESRAPSAMSQISMNSLQSARSTQGPIAPVENLPQVILETDPEPINRRERARTFLKDTFEDDDFKKNLFRYMKVYLVYLLVIPLMSIVYFTSKDSDDVCNFDTLSLSIWSEVVLGIYLAVFIRVATQFIMVNCLHRESVCGFMVFIALFEWPILTTWSAVGIDLITSDEANSCYEAHGHTLDNIFIATKILLIFTIPIIASPLAFVGYFMFNIYKQGKCCTRWWESEDKPEPFKLEQI